MEEIWKDIEGYEGLYQVSNLGNIKSLSRLSPSRDGILINLPEKIIKLGIRARGYVTVTLSNNRVRKAYYVHRLVALHFISNPSSLPDVNHIDCSKINNHTENLEWVTERENQTHSPRRNKTSHFSNVKFNKQRNTWVSEITISKKRIRIGSFHNEEDAYQAYLVFLYENGIQNKYAA